MWVASALTLLSLYLSGVAARPQVSHEKRLFGLTFSSTTTTVPTTTTAAHAKTTGTTTTTSQITTSSLATVAAVTPTVKQKAVENKFWKTFKAQGVNLGNWLVLEEWMYSSFYGNYSSTGTDEWTFCESLGQDCESVLSAHWDSWITEADIRQVSSLGYNLLRLPIGHWGLIPTTVDEPYVFSSQLQQVERVMQYANDMGLYVVLDIHGLPGSQNGKAHSGHAGTIDWFTKANQKRSLSAVTAAIDFIYASSNKAVIAALEIANEPNITTSSHRKTYESYIKDAKKIIHGINASMPIMFHDGFLGADEWSKFTKDAKDNYVIDVHEYFTGLTSNSVSAVKDVCTLAAAQANEKSKTPVIVGEFSVSVGGVYLDTDAWRREFYETQVEQFSGPGLAGSAFWSIKAFDDGSDTTQNNGWSVQALADAGSVTSSTWDVVNAIACPA